MSLIFAKNHYELLEISPEASTEEIRKAYERLKALYSPSTPGISSLFDEEELEEIQRRLEEAYQVLSDEERKRRYNLSLERESPPAAVTLGTPPEELLSTVLKEEKGLGGRALRRLREGMGISLNELSRVTKMSKSTLRAIEEERLDALPAWVFVKGFLKVYAKTIGLDPERVISDYGKRVLGGR